MRRAFGHADAAALAGALTHQGLTLDHHCPVGAGTDTGQAGGAGPVRGRKARVTLISSGSPGDKNSRTAAAARTAVRRASPSGSGSRPAASTKMPWRLVVAVRWYRLSRPLSASGRPGPAFKPDAARAGGLPGDAQLFTDYQKSRVKSYSPARGAAVAATLTGCPLPGRGFSCRPFPGVCWWRSMVPDSSAGTAGAWQVGSLTISASPSQAVVPLV